MTRNDKYLALVMLGLVITSTAIIAVGLPQLEFQPGMPLPSVTNGQVVAVPAAAVPIVVVHLNKFVSVLLALVLTGSLLYVTFQLLRKGHWKDIWSHIRHVVITSLFVVVIPFLILLLPHAPIDLPAEMLLPKAEPWLTSPLGVAPPIVIWLVGLALLASTVLLGVWIVTSARRDRSLDLIGAEAKQAWQALKTGLSLKEAIIRCYRQMSLVLERDKGIEREYFMTTGEFEERLEAEGFPHEPVHQLTQLFEAVRYGNWQPNPADEKKAIVCLESIMSFSNESTETGPNE